MYVEAIPLAHGFSTDSAAFLIESDGFYALILKTFNKLALMVNPNHPDKV
jgi:hypothetical protein